MIKLLQFLIILNISFSILAKNTAKIVFIKGEATQLKPGDKHAIELKKGDYLIEDTSIHTKKKCVVKIKYYDNSMLTIGPNSLIRLAKIEKGKANLVGLLKGMVRGQVQKSGNANGKHKFYLKTKTASIGIRGTEFNLSHNTENDVTGLLTFKGKVSIKRKSKSDINYHDTSTEFMEQELKSKKTQLVQTGRYANLNPTDKVDIAPVKIDPVQFVLLEKNKNLNPKKRSKVSKKEIDIAIKKMQKVKDVASSQKKINNGGYVDLKTGLYVQPTTQIKLSDYKIKKAIGTVTASGNYKAPKGIILTARDGFKLNQKVKLKDNEKKEILNKLNTINTINKVNLIKKRAIPTQLQNQKKKEPELDQKVDIKKVIPPKGKKHGWYEKIIFSIHAIQSDIKTDNSFVDNTNPGDTTGQDHQSDDLDINLAFDFFWSSSWTTYAGVGSYDNSFFGIKYVTTGIMKYFITFNNQARDIKVFSSTRDEKVGNIEFGTQMRIWKTEGTQTHLGLKLLGLSELDLEEDNKKIHFKDGGGLQFYFIFNYQLNQKWGLSLTAATENVDYKMTYRALNINAVLQDFTLETETVTNSLGLKFHYTW